MFDSYDQAGVYLGVLDTIFMSCYAVGLYASGWIAERVSIRKFITIGTALNAITLFIFGCVLPWTNCTSFGVWVRDCHHENIFNSHPHIGSILCFNLMANPFWAFVWAINGLSQSSGWPSIVALMGNWFGIKGRGVIMGIWSANASVGNIMGAFMVNGFLGYGFSYSFLFVSLCLLLFSCSNR